MIRCVTRMSPKGPAGGSLFRSAPTWLRIAFEIGAMRSRSRMCAAMLSAVAPGNHPGPCRRARRIRDVERRVPGGIGGLHVRVEGDLLRGDHRVPVTFRRERDVMRGERDGAGGVDRLDQHHTTEHGGIARLPNEQRRSVGDAVGLARDEVLLLDVPGLREWQGRETRSRNRLRVGAVERSGVRGDRNRTLELRRSRRHGVHSLCPAAAWACRELVHRDAFEEHRFLRREVTEHGSATNARRDGDLIDRRLRVPLTHEEPECRVCDPRPCVPGLAGANRRSHAVASYRASCTHAVACRGVTVTRSRHDPRRTSDG